MKRLNKKGQSISESWLAWVVIIALGALLIGGGYWYFYVKGKVVISGLPSEYSIAIAECAAMISSNTLAPYLKTSYCVDAKQIGGKDIYATCGWESMRSAVAASKSKVLKDIPKCEDSYTDAIRTACSTKIGTKDKITFNQVEINKADKDSDCATAAGMGVGGPP